MIEVVRTHLEMRDLGSLKPSATPAGAHRIERQEDITAARYRELYAQVGADWHWHDRLVWTDDQITAHVVSPDIAVWILEVSDTTAGYFELQRHSAEHVEIAYFGLLPSFIGMGFGGWMLTRAVQESFALGARRVTLHTCTLDSRHALPNYLARGFTAVREERYLVEPEAQPL